MSLSCVMCVVQISKCSRANRPWRSRFGVSSTHDVFFRTKVSLCNIGRCLQVNKCNALYYGCLFYTEKRGHVGISTITFQHRRAVPRLNAPLFVVFPPSDLLCPSRQLCPFAGQTSLLLLWPHNGWRAASASLQRHRHPVCVCVCALISVCRWRSLTAHVWPSYLLAPIFTAFLGSTQFKVEVLRFLNIFGSPGHRILLFIVISHYKTFWVLLFIT